MSALAETLLTALCVSTLAACCLALLPRTPPRVRFAITIAGLAAWVVPWGAIRVALPTPPAMAAPLVEWLDAADALASGATPPSLELGATLGYAVAAAFLVGLALFIRDYLSLGRCLRAWRARSRPADELRSLLPRELAGVLAEIRVLEHSTVAAVSGALRPTIWIGDRHLGRYRALVLTHEMWHVRARDPAWLFAIAAVRRAYWWNPLVAYLARQAVLMIEAACDHRCAVQFGKTAYMADLASLLLARDDAGTATGGIGRSREFRRATIALAGPAVAPSRPRSRTDCDARRGGHRCGRRRRRRSLADGSRSGCAARTFARNAGRRRAGEADPRRERRRDRARRRAARRLYAAGARATSAGFRERSARRGARTASRCASSMSSRARAANGMQASLPSALRRRRPSRRHGCGRCRDGTRAIATFGNPMRDTHCHRLHGRG